MFEPDAPGPKDRFVGCWREVALDNGGLIGVCDVIALTLVERVCAERDGPTSWGSERTSLDEPQP